MSDPILDSTPESPHTLLLRLGEAFTPRKSDSPTSHRKYSTGQLAEFRRLDFRRGYLSTGPAFWQLVAYELEPAGFLHRDDIYALRRWMALIQGLATLAPAGLHQPGIRLGEALAEAEIAEIRVARLLAAGGDGLLAQLRPIAHLLKSKAQAVDWAYMGDLVLSDGRQPWAENERRRLARYFYRRQYQLGKPTSENPNETPVS